MMIDTESGTDGAPQLTSNVSVDPGEVQAYARFLAEMNTDLKQLRTAVKRLERFDDTVFGAYAASAAAARQNRQTIVTEGKFLDSLSGRLGKVVDGTRELARDYADLDELNATSGSAIRDQLSSDSTDA